MLTVRLRELLYVLDKELERSRAAASDGLGRLLLFLQRRDPRFDVRLRDIDGSLSEFDLRNETNTK